jgi:hypothetical protein
MHHVTLPFAFWASVGVTVPPLWTEPDAPPLELELELPPLLLLLLLPHPAATPAAQMRTAPSTAKCFFTILLL